MRAFSLIIFIICFIGISFGQKYESPGEYNNFILSEQNKLLKKILEYNNTIANANFEESNLKRTEIIYQINFSLERLNAMETFKGDAKLKESSIEVFRQYKETYDIEFNEVNKLRKDRETSFEAMKNYTYALDKAEEKLKDAGEKFYKAQTEFAKKYKITIVTNSLQVMLEDQWKLNRHIRNVHLEFFRVYKADELFMNAMNNQDVESMEKRRVEIIKSAEASLANLKNIPTYRNDTVFASIALKLVLFHKRIAEKEYSELVKVLMKKEAMTNEDINHFNTIASQVNSQAQRMLTEFNTEKREIMRRHAVLAE
jgi:hypothetical protein